MGSHVMLDFRNKHTAEREKIIAEGIAEVVAELRLVEVVDYIAFLRMEHFGNVADIVNSSSQLYMKAGTLRFAGDGEVHMSWNTPATIELGMEFRHAGIVAHFRLGLAAATASVNLTYIAFERSDVGPETNTAALAAAIAAARLNWRGAN